MEIKNKDNPFILIPKCERYIEYVITIVVKLPRIEKFSIGMEVKKAAYVMIANILYLTKITNKLKLEYCNKIDADISIQRMYIRIMYRQRYIDEKKYRYAIELLSEIRKTIRRLYKMDRCRVWQKHLRMYLIKHLQ